MMSLENIYTALTVFNNETIFLTNNMYIKNNLSSSKTLLALLRTNSIIAGMSYIAARKKHYKIAKMILVLSFIINIIYTTFFLIFHYTSFKNHDEKIMYYYSPILFSLLYSVILISLFTIY